MKFRPLHDRLVVERRRLLREQGTRPMGVSQLDYPTVSR
jgi:hypothetical protein